MPLRTCEHCHARLYPAHTGRPVRFCSPACRQAARRALLLAQQYSAPWQQRALKEGWRPPERPR